MFLFRKPSQLFIDEFLAQQAALPFTYEPVGATQTPPPPRFVVDRTNIQLGHGKTIFNAAQHALRRWEHFRLGWVQPCLPTAPIEPGQVVGVLARFCGLWSLNACRIVYVIDEPRLFGFAYGTLPDHVESGEERFTVAWNETDDAVHYDILAFSRPNHPLARLGYPIVRRLQKRFARDSAAAMRKAIEGSG